MGRAEDWVLIEKELRSAWSLLPVGLVESAEGYCEADFLQYLNNNEYLLAMEELDGKQIPSRISLNPTFRI